MYRRLECSTWDDPWFSELDPDAKLLFLYLITNRRTTACGAFEITLRAMAFETGLPNVEATIAKLGDRVVWWPQHQAIFVRNFFRWQSDSTNKSNFRVGAMKALAQFPIEIVETVTNVYPELRENGGSHPHPIPIPSPTHGEEETVTVTVEETGGGGGANAPDPPPPVPINRARQIPEDFAVTDKLREWGYGYGLTDAQMDRVTERFINYWKGEGKAKKDWDATWRNWVLREIDDGRMRPAAGEHRGLVV